MYRIHNTDCEEGIPRVFILRIMEVVLALVVFQGGILIVPPDFQFQKETSRRKPQVLFQEIVFLAELGFPF